MPVRKRLSDPAAIPTSLTKGTQPYGRGSALSLPRMQFQLLYREIGYAQAKEIGCDERFILWPMPDPPPEHLLYAWAMEADQDGCEIPQNVETAFKKRWENYAKALAIRTVRGTARLSQDFTKLASSLYREASDGKIDEDKLRLVKDTTSVLMHANNGTGFIFRELVGSASKKDAPPQQINNFLLNAGAPPERKQRISRKQIQKQIPQNVIIDAEVREVSV